jgi:hypothetical protein
MSLLRFVRLSLIILSESQIRILCVSALLSVQVINPPGGVLDAVATTAGVNSSFVSLVLIQDRALGTTTYFTNGNALRRSLQTDSGYIAVIAVDTAGASVTPSQVTSNFASGLQTDPTGPLAGVTLGVNSVAQPGVAAPPAAAQSNSDNNSNAAVIGGAVGGTVAALVILIVIAVIIVAVNKNVSACCIPVLSF